MNDTKPEDLILRVIAELAHHNTFDGNFNAEPLSLLLTFVKCPDDGLRALVDGKLMQQANRHHIMHFKAAYRITLFEVGKSIEAKIAVQSDQITALERGVAFGEVRPQFRLKQVIAFLRTLPVKENEYNVDS